MNTLAAEWLKLTRTRATRIAYPLLVAFTIVFAVVFTSGSSTYPPGAGGDNDIVADALVGVLVGVIVTAVIGAVSTGNEHGSGMIATTLAAEPRRHRVLAVKALLVGVTTAVLGGAASLAGLLAARPMQRSNGFRAPGYPDPDLTSEPVLRAIAGSGLLIGLVALMAVGIAAAVRRTSIAIPVTIGLFMVPVLLSTDDDWARRIGRYSPVAGFAIQHTIDREDYYIAPWAGLAVLAAYAAAALVVGAIAFNRADV